MVQFESDRLIFREWKASDHQDFINMNQDKVVMEFFPRLQTVEESLALIDRQNKSIAENQFGFWAVEVKATNEFIGFLGLNTPAYETHFTPCIEIGWRFKRSAWGKGYATEGAKRVLDYAFRDLGLKEVVSFTAVPNEKSWKVMQKIGMIHRPEEDFDHPRVEGGHFLQRHVLYRITPEVFYK